MTGAKQELSMRVDGVERTVAVDAAARLSDVLRDQLGAKAVRQGCGTGDCGACTVISVGAPIKSCLELALDHPSGDITTLAGIGTEERLHPVQQAFWDAFGFQCGFCISGMVLVAIDLLRHNPSPKEAEVRDALIGNLCRCTGYDSIVDAVMLAAERMGREA